MCIRDRYSGVVSTRLFRVLNYVEITKQEGLHENETIGRSGHREDAGG